MLTPDETALLARIDLLHLDATGRTMKDSPIVIAVAKALTLAQLHPDVEARVVCDTLADAVDALLILHGRVGQQCGGKWSILTKTLELPNGSAVVIELKLPGPDLRALDEGRDG